MTNYRKIDVVAFDQKTNRVILSLIETRPWGDRGENIRDLHEKLNTYWSYVLGGADLVRLPYNAGQACCVQAACSISAYGQGGAMHRDH